MVERPYPTSLAELDAWRLKYGTTSDEARKRLIQYVILEGIAGASELASTLVFKGGNALRFVYSNLRTTLDLDFTALAGFPDDPGKIRESVNLALAESSQRFGVALRCQRVYRNPPNPARTFPTYTVKVGYQLPGDRRFAGFLTSEHTVSSIVELEISLNDVVCDASQSRPISSESGEIRVRVCALEDILAEKLRALLQQPIRRRNRRQDVYDIAHMLELHENTLDKQKIGQYLLRKAAARGVGVCIAAFDNPEVKQRASVDYENLFSKIDPNFIPFETAWAGVMRLVRALDIPT